MNRFLADFEWNREHEMVLTSEQGISREALEPVELEMLENCSVPGLLPMEWQDWNGLVRFRYRLTGRKMLKHRLAEGMDSVRDFYGFLSALSVHAWNAAIICFVLSIFFWTRSLFSLVPIGRNWGWLISR